MIIACIIFSITLEDAVKVAVENNLLIKSSQETVESVLYSSRKALSLLLPKFNSSFSYSHIFKLPVVEFEIPNPVGGVIKREQEVGRKEQTTISISVQEFLPIDGSYWYLKKAEDMNYEASKFDLEHMKNRIAYDTASLYINALRLKEFERVSTFVIEDLKEHLRVAEHLFNNGIISEVELFRVKSSLVDAEASLQDVKQNYEKIISALIVITGTEIYPEDEISALFPKYSNYFDVDGTELSQKINSRYDMLSAKSNIERLKNLSLYERGKMFPQVGMGFTLLNSFGGFVESKNIPSFALQANFTFFEWGSSYYSYLALKRQVKSAERKFSFLKQQSLDELRNSYSEIKLLKDKLKAAESFFETSKMGLSYAKELYKEGKIKTSELMDSETQFQKSWANLISVRADIIIAVWKIKFLSGEKLYD